MYNQKLGKIGEDLALSYLIKQGHKIVSTNFRSPYGEVDVISISPSNQLVFSEVKTRTCNNFGSPQDSVNRLKRLRIIKTALYFINQSSKKITHGWRIDVISVQLNHIKNISDG
ncbi:YraN family protein [Patescibacteria group bacterium]|nr:YraN family protein [Patescibacteria group bacterium]